MQILQGRLLHPDRGVYVSCDEGAVRAHAELTVLFFDPDAPDAAAVAASEEPTIRRCVQGRIRLLPRAAQAAQRVATSAEATSAEATSAEAPLLGPVFEWRSGAVQDRTVVLTSAQAHALLTTDGDAGGVLSPPRRGFNLTELTPSEFMAFFAPPEWPVQQLFAQMRRCFVHPFDALSPIDLAILKVAILDTNEGWGKLCHLLDNGHTRVTSNGASASAGPNRRARTDLTAFYCNETTNLWKAASLTYVWGAVWNLVRMRVSVLADTHASFLPGGGLLGALLRCLLERGEVTASDLTRACKRAMPSQRQALNLFKNGLQEPIAQLQYLVMLLEATSPVDGTREWGPRLFSIKEKFFELVHVEELGLDAKRLIVFSDGWCYDPAVGERRRITPQDGARRNTRYPMPSEVPDVEKEALLMKELAQFHTDPAVLEWRICEKAARLDYNQASPRASFCFGTAGGGKSTEASLTLKMWGDYGATIKEGVIRSSRDAEAPTSELARVEGCTYLFFDEFKGAAADTIKQLLSSGEITVALKGENARPVRASWSLEFAFNAKDDKKKEAKIEGLDDGFKRRCRVTEYRSTIIRCSSEADEQRQHEEWRECPPDSPCFTTTDARYARLMELAPTLMAICLRKHAAVVKGLDTWPPDPDAVEHATAEMIGKSANEEGTAGDLCTPLRALFMRCACMPTNPLISDTSDLADPTTGAACTHRLTGAQIKKELHSMTVANKGQSTSLYRKLKGASRGEANIWSTIANANAFDVRLKFLKQHRLAPGQPNESNVVFGLQVRPVEQRNQVLRNLLEAERTARQPQHRD